MASVKKRADEADFNLKSISHTVEDGNRSAEREFNIIDQRYGSGGSRKVTCTKSRTKPGKLISLSVPDSPKNTVIVQQWKLRL